MQTTEALTSRQLERCSGRILGKMRRTSRRWTVFPENGALAMAVSGGIDSLAMAYLCSLRNRSLRQPLDLSVVHVRLDSDGPTAGLPDRTSEWLEALGLETVEVEARFDGSPEYPLNCYSCARARRRTLLEAAENIGARHVAIGHHADDVVETWLLSLMFTGTAEAIPPVRSYLGGAVTVVRPLFELQRREMIRLARLADFPDPIAACRRELEAKRERVRQALSALGRDQNRVRRQLYWAAVRQIDEANDDASLPATV